MNVILICNYSSDKLLVRRFQLYNHLHAIYKAFYSYYKFIAAGTTKPIQYSKWYITDL